MSNFNINDVVKTITSQSDYYQKGIVGIVEFIEADGDVLVNFRNQSNPEGSFDDTIDGAWWIAGKDLMLVQQAASQKSLSDIRTAKKALEKEIYDAISGKIVKFQEDNNVKISWFSLETVEMHEIGKEIPKTILREVSVEISI